MEGYFVKYVVELHIFSNKLKKIMCDKELVDKKENPDPIKLYNLLYPDDKITQDMIKLDRQKVTDKTRNIRNWIQGKNYPKSIRDILLLCNALECDLDYFFTDMECETHDKQFIHYKTGLSEKAIERITSTNDDTPDQFFLNSFILSEEFIEIEHNMSWIKNDCHNISQHYKVFEEINSAIEKTDDETEFNKLDILRDRYANKLEHNGNQIQFLMYQCSLSFGNFMNKIRKSWGNEINYTLESLEKPLPGLEIAKKS